MTEPDKQYGMVFSDIDGTLITSDHRLTEGTIAKIQELDARQIPFVLVSARMPSGIYPIQRALGITEAIIAYSGALIINRHGKTEVSKGICLEKALGVERYIHDQWPRVTMTAYSGDEWCVESFDDPWVQQEQRIAGTAYSVGDIADFIKEKETVHKFLCMGEPEVISYLAQLLEKGFTGLSVYRSKPTYLEIMDGEVSKAQAVTYLCEKYEVPIEAAVSFGDNYNDLDMLSTTGLSYAMANAPVEVRQVAALVTEDNDNDGVLKGLEKLKFAKRSK